MSRIVPTNMTRAKSDRRRNRTQHSLHVTLNRLILEKGYDAVTIKDLTNRADVGRSTFYAHHGSKDGLLLNGLQHLRSALIAAQRNPRTKPHGAREQPLAFSRTFFEHVHTYRDVYRALLRSQSGLAVTETIKRIVADVIRDEFKRAANTRTSEIPREAVVSFTVDALFSILGWWFEHSPKLAPAEVDTIFCRLAGPALAAAEIR